MDIFIGGYLGYRPNTRNDVEPRNKSIAMLCHVTNVHLFRIGAGELIHCPWEHAPVRPTTQENLLVVSQLQHAHPAVAHWKLGNDTPTLPPNSPHMCASVYHRQAILELSVLSASSEVR